MNMKTNTHRRGLHRIVAFLLCAVCVFSLLPAQAFAAGVGQKASSWLGDQYVGSDGQHYYSPVPPNFLAYNSDGTTDKRSGSGGSAYRHYMLTDSDGVTHSVYCVESGIPYNTSENTYTSENGTNSDYLNMLPSAARRGITLTAIYGWKPGASLPVSGINEDDYKMATQIILWEYQQQLRSDPYSRHSNGHASADQYYSVVAGRPAEKAYNWILEQVASHSTVPSFTAANKGDAPVLELKWDTSRKVYTLTVTDTNNLNIDLQMLSGSGVTVSRNGNQYTFTSKNMIMEPAAKRSSWWWPPARISQPEVQFSDVAFAYQDKEVLHNISFSMQKNTMTALVGPSGGGKSTIANLLARLWDVKSGTVTVRGTDIRDVPLAELMEQISMVFQRVYLFQDTIYNNISMGKPDATEQEVYEAAKKARCYDFIMALPDGFQTVVGEGGATLSGGEKQRISIARCILKDAPIVILDEATASVDTDNESYIQEAINELVKGKTLLVIAHRLNTIRQADQILVISNGQISEQGTHDELMAKAGIYQEFVNIRKKSAGWSLT